MKRKFLAWLLTIAMVFNMALPYAAFADELPIDTDASYSAGEFGATNNDDATDVGGDSTVGEPAGDGEQGATQGDEPQGEEPAAGADDDTEYTGEEVGEEPTEEPAEEPQDDEPVGDDETPADETVADEQPAADVVAGLLGNFAAQALDEGIMPVADVQLNQKHLLKALKFGKNNDLKDVTLQDGVYAYDVYLPADQDSAYINATRTTDSSNSTTLVLTYKNASGADRSAKLTSGSNRYVGSIVNKDMNGTTLTLTVTDGDYQTVYTLNVKRTVVLALGKVTDANGNSLSVVNDEYLLLNGEDKVKITANGYGATLTVGGNAATDNTAYEYTVTAAVDSTETIEIKATSGEQSESKTITVRRSDSNSEFTGTCGPGATWKLQGDTLTIGGSGVMSYSGTAPWFAYPTAKSVKNVVVGDEITAIGDGAFQNMECSSVSIGSKVTSIGKNAFNGCTGITAITLPAGLLSIGDSAFNGCTGISEIAIPANLGTVGASAFAGCTKLEKIELPDTVATVGASAFKGCSALKTAKLPSGLTEISDNLFSTCSNLESVNIPVNVSKIGASSFLACKKLAYVTLPGNISEIGGSAFKNCNVLTDITIPNSVTTIGTYAFAECENLKNVTMSTGLTKIGTHTFYNCLKLEGVSTLGQITELPQYLFYNCASLKTIDIPSGVTKLGSSVFQGCKVLNNVTLPDNITETTSSLFENCAGLTEIEIPGNVTKINGSFKGCTSLVKVVLPDGLTEIGMGSFGGCTSLATINFPTGLKKISTQAFAACKALTKVELSATTELNGNAIFFGCDGLKEVTLGKIKTGAAIFGGCTALEKVTFLDGATSFGNQTFNTYKVDKYGGQLPSCTALKSVVLPASLTDWGTNAFDKAALANIKFSGDGAANFSFGDGVIYNKEQTSILYLNPDYTGEFVVPAAMTELQSGCFKDCTKITKITFAEGSQLTAIPSEAFAGCTSLTEVVLPASVKTIGSSAFKGCTALTNPGLQEGLESIGYNAFEGCEQLVTLNLPDSLTSIGTGFIKTSGIRELVVPAGVTTLVENQFGECENVEKIVVKGNVTTIPQGAFKPCDSLKTLVLPKSVSKVDNGDINFYETCFKRDMTIFYEGTVAEWKNVDPNGKEFLGTVICNYVEPTTEDGTLVVDSKSENIIANVADLGSKSLFVTLKYPDGYSKQDGDKITADWYYATAALDGYKGLKLLSGYTWDEETLTATASLTEQAKNTQLSSWAYYLMVFKTDKDGNTTMLLTDPINVLGLTDGFSLAGEGSHSNPFQISKYEDLQLIATMVDAGSTFNDIHFKLTNSFDVPADWQGIGNHITGKKFSGTLDGDGNTLTFLNDGTNAANALFDYTSGATVENLKLKGAAFKTSALAYNFEGNITNCTLVNGTTTNKSGFVQESGSAYFTNCTVESGVKIGWDGIANAAASNKTVASFLGSGSCVIVSCQSAADVYGDSVVAGILGSKMYSMRPAIVRNSTFSGTITATGEYVGGIVAKGCDAYSAPNATCVRIENCLVQADITGARAVGGVFGGEAGVEQAWDNGIGYIRNNMFYGSLTLKPREFDPWDRGAGNACPADNIDGSIGGIIGFMRSLNVYTVIENNYFYDINGTSKGIGAVEHIDTTTHEFGYDENEKIFYYDSRRDDGLDIKNWVDREDKDHEDWKWTSVITGFGVLHRTDDPMGKDADKLAKAMTVDEMKDGTVKALLNTGEASWHNWIQAESDVHPVISEEAVPYQLEIGGTYKTEYYIGDELDMTGATFTATWTDGTTTTVPLDKVSFTGFKSTERAILTVIAHYENISAEFEVKVLLKGGSEGGNSGNSTIKVYFTLLGDYHHEYEDDPTLIHTYKKGNLQTWLSKEAYTVDLNATVADLLKEVEKKHDNVSFSNPKGNWVDAVTFGDLTMTQLDNTDNSGWQYNVNKKHTELLVNEYFLNNGDSVIWYWTDDYTQDMGSEGYDNSGNQLGGGGSSVKDETKTEEKTDEKTPEASSSDLPFTDVKAGAWYYDAIKAMYDKGLMNGESATQFMPNNKLSRAMLVTILYRMQNEPEVSATANFADVAAGQWYTKAVAWASANNIVSGVGDGKFAPNDSITRQELAAMLYRYASATGLNTTATANLGSFSDSNSVTTWAETAMQWAVGTGLIKGDETGALNPTGTATRAEVATVIVRLLELSAK